ncbi:unnamed protein product [Sympodiomycopsis kandeliae]
MSQQAKLTLRAPPHQPFVQGWPGIPEGKGRPAAHIKGTVEVRLGGKGFKASWLRIELRKIESTPTGENWGELIGRGPIEVWTADGHSDQDSEGKWDLLQTADFPFKIMIPEGLPPSAKLDKQSGISYEIVTSLCVKVKKGLLRKEETSSVIQSSHPVTLEKHDLHSTWPIYSIPDDHEEMVDQVIARVYRKQTCYGPGDKVMLRVILTSKNVSPVKIKAVAVSIRETITFKGGKRQSRMLGPATKTANQRAIMLAQKSKSVGQKLYKGDVKTYDMDLVIPKSHALMTIRTAKHIEVSYTMRIYVDCKHPIILDHLPITLTTVPRETSAKIVPQIGFVPGLSASVDSQESTRYEEQIVRPQSAQHSRPFAHTSGGIDGDHHTTNRRHAGPTRSISFVSSSTSSDRTYRANNNNLNRQDTVRTTASGPGLAGRGIPGHIFDYNNNAYGSYPSSPFEHPNQRGPVRLAFAGPASIYEGRELNLEENRALFHHSANNHLGEVFEGQDPVPSVNFDGISPTGMDSRGHTPSRSLVGTPAATPPDTHYGQRRHRVFSEGDNNNSYFDARSPAQSSAVSPHEAAEMEKERLYHRAREQAERNQRKAAAAAAVAAAAAHSPANAGPGGHRSVSSPVTSPGGAGSAINEKQALYERARREAQRYQSGYAEGATFPPEEPEPQPRPAPVLATPTPQRGALSGFPTAEEEKKRLYETAKAQRDSFLATQTSRTTSPAYSRRHSSQGNSPYASRPQSVVGPSGSSNVSSPSGVAASSSSSSPSKRNGPYPAGSSSAATMSNSASASFPSADEEKRRFAAARAETDAFLRSQQQQSNGGVASGSGSGSTSQDTTMAPPTPKVSAATTAPVPPQITVNGSEAAARGLMSAEAEQKMLYEKAKAEVEAHRDANMGGSSSSSTQAAGSSTSRMSSSFPSAEEEKRRLYEQAKAEVDAHQSGSSSSAQVEAEAPQYQSSSSSSTSAGPPPRPPISADDEKAQLRRYYEAQDAVARHQRQDPQNAVSSSHSMDPSVEVPGAFPSSSMSRESSYMGDETASITSDSSSYHPYRSPSVAAGKQRSLPTPTQSPPPRLPTFSFASLSSDLPATTTTTSNNGSSFAPRIASPNWHEEDEGYNGGALTGLPPPLPPKTPLKH